MRLVQNRIQPNFSLIWVGPLFVHEMDPATHPSNGSILQVHFRLVLPDLPTALLSYGPIYQTYLVASTFLCLTKRQKCQPAGPLVGAMNFLSKQLAGFYLDWKLGMVAEGKHITKSSKTNRINFELTPER